MDVLLGEKGHVLISLRSEKPSLSESVNQECYVSESIIDCQAQPLDQIWLMSSTNGFGVVVLVRSEPLLIIPSVFVNNGCWILVRNFNFETREFNGCKRAWIPKTVDQLHQSCFEDITSLRDVVFEPESRLRCIPTEGFSNTMTCTFVIPKTVETLSTCCFSRCSRLDTVFFSPGSDLQRIEELAFASSSVTGIIIPRSVRILEKSCFNGCQRLDHVIFESGSRLEQIEESAFQSSSLKEIILPKSIRHVSASAFDRACESISVEEPSDHIVSRDGFLEDLSTRSLILYFGFSQRVVVDHPIVGHGCFSHVATMSTVVFGPSLSRIGDGAFYQSSLAHVTIPKSVSALGICCFGCCSSLETVAFEPGSRLDRLEKGMFYWSSLVRITIPRSVRALGKSSFSYCKSLEEVAFEPGSELERVEESVFASSPALQWSSLPLPESANQLAAPLDIIHC
jgi:hypothetical protein